MGYYKLQRSVNNQFFWNLHADNHEKILSSETYTTKGAAIGGISSCRENSSVDSQYTRFENPNRQHFFNLKAKNHEIIGKSEPYTSAQGRENGIASCKANGPNGRIDDQTGV